MSELRRRLRTFLPPSLHGIAFDVAFLLASVLVLRVLSERFLELMRRAFVDKEPQALLTVSLLFATVHGLRLAGLYVKRYPLQLRIRWNGEGSWPGMASFCISGGLSFLLAATAGVAMNEFLQAQEGLDDAVVTGAMVVIFLSILPLAYTEIWLYGRVMTPLAPGEAATAAADWRFSRGAELYADVAILASVLLWQFLYEAALLLFEPAQGASGAWGVLRQLPLHFAAFVLLYVAPRSVFLFEDARYRATWVTLTLVFAEQVGRRLV